MEEARFKILPLVPRIAKNGRYHQLRGPRPSAVCTSLCTRNEESVYTPLALEHSHVLLLARNLSKQQGRESLRREDQGADQLKVDLPKIQVLSHGYNSLLLFWVYVRTRDSWRKTIFLRWEDKDHNLSNMAGRSCSKNIQANSEFPFSLPTKLK